MLANMRPSDVFLLFTIHETNKLVVLEQSSHAFRVSVTSIVFLSDAQLSGATRFSACGNFDGIVVLPNAVREIQSIHSPLDLCVSHDCSLG